MPELIPCPTCGRHSLKADTCCPHCGKCTKSGRTTTAALVGLAVAAAGFQGCSSELYGIAVAVDTNAVGDTGDTGDTGESGDTGED